MLVHVALDRLYPEYRAWAYIGKGIPFIQLCKAFRVPHYVAVSPEGDSDFRYDPVVAPVNFCTPQFLASSLGGLICLLVARWVPKRSKSLGPSSPR